MTEAKTMTRRDFLKAAGATGAGFVVGGAGGAAAARRFERVSAVPESPMEKLRSAFAEIEKNPLSVPELLDALRTGNGLPDVSVVTYDEPGKHFNTSTGEFEPGKKNLKALCFRISNGSVMPVGDVTVLGYTSNPKKDLGSDVPEAFTFVQVSENSFPLNGAFFEGLASGEQIPRLDRQIGVMTIGDFQGAVVRFAEEAGIYVGGLG